ncbi:motility associated factor glycosyltransferase family protein [Ammoniphilus sp. CFH 90114]|uniref:motility associated factor glycosyltransferase family protein n=1 Tax=Ammoniphilus sp. CFH 90114 TaxID=2493665 RepID=UPI00100E3482|nr:6-hydroxymethylpterin diphosphokinase MptE-like protein [Ammoniphilus sp. CFH 90114]RXT04471.1 DUF115 domain-containing protein [Ammoniphilus sp. CFH 90114]
MILIDNIQILKRNHPLVWEKMKRLEEEGLDNGVKIEDSRSGLPTICVERDQQSYFIHSKYDPLNEAERFVNQYSEEELRKYKHVLFYGTGLGYHIERFVKKFNLPFTIYEPNGTIFYHFLSNQSLREKWGKLLQDIYIELEKGDRARFFKQFLEQVKEKVLFIPLPGYERAFSETYEDFTNEFTELLSTKQFSMNADQAFEKLWTINSMLNFSQTMFTPNILTEKKRYFEKKPAILVAAGPSLQEEIVNLRYIKENGLAYIFSVGSAINALVEYGIFPDAACTYDPQPHNFHVFEKVVSKEIKSIPLIYGTSVCSETVKRYTGPLLHMTMNQDTITPFYINNVPSDEVIFDAPTIAVVTLQLLIKMECTPIILVGQNLAFKNNQYYATGIDYQPYEHQLKQTDLVEDVYGNLVNTSEEFNRMRTELEMHLSHHAGYEVINTTKGGARIRGTAFQPLEEVIYNRLKNKVVEEEWFKSDLLSVKRTIRQQAELMETEYEELLQLLNQVDELFIDMNRLKGNNKLNKLEKKFTEFDKVIRRIMNNSFFLVFLKPMNRVQLELLTKHITEIRFENNLPNKVEKVIGEFGKFLYGCKKDLDHVNPIFREMQETIKDSVDIKIVTANR